MASLTALDLVVGLGRQSERAEAAARLSTHVGVETILLFVKDPIVNALVPAAGMDQTIVGGSIWREFLSRCESAGRHVGEVDLPPKSRRQAVAFSTAGMSVVLIGGERRLEEAELLARMLPLLDATLSAEQRALDATAEAQGAREVAHRANALNTALESARSEASRLNAELHAEDRYKDEFLAMLAHELRNPLAPLVTAIDLLRRQPADATTPRLIELMARQVAQLARLVEDLMDVSRVSHGRIELRLQRIELSQLLADAVEANRHLLDAKCHRVSIARPMEPLMVRGDSARLTQVFSNLINNAAKYTDPGGEVRLTARREADQAIIEVADTGIGIVTTMLPRVFDLFAQASASIDRAQGGLGIGLTLVRKLLELHGGTVAARSAGPGLGSAFTVTLPLFEEHESLGPRETVREPPTHARARLRILVVDDNVDAADVLAQLLDADGHETEVAYAGEPALISLREKSYDLAFIDLGLPKMDGYELARRVRATRGGSIRLVALTGYGSEADRRRSLDAGFDVHCVKPISEEELRRVTSSLKRRP